MLTFVVRRLLLGVLSLLGVLVIMYMLMHVAPVDPARQFAGAHATPEKLAEVRAQLGLDRPVPVQILTYMKNFFTGNWGESLSTKRPVLEDIRRTLPYTLELIILGLLITLLVGIPLGVISAQQKDLPLDHFSRVFAVGLISIPTFWLALALQYILSGQLGFLPLSGPGSQEVMYVHPIVNVTGFPLMDALVTGNFVAFWDHATHLVMPTLAIAAMSLGAIQRITRSSMVDALSDDYITAKRSYGLAEYTILFRHGLKNASGPVTIIAAIYFASMLVNTFLVEAIFSWPGIGSYIASGVANLDYPVIMGVTLVSAVTFLITNFVADVLLGVDPRVRISEKP